MARSWQTWIALLIFVAGFGGLKLLPVDAAVDAAQSVLHFQHPLNGFLAGVVMGLILSLPFIVAAVLLGRVGDRCYRLALAEHGICPTCGYDLTGNTSGVCPECGTTIRRPGIRSGPAASS